MDSLTMELARVCELLMHPAVDPYGKVIDRLRKEDHARAEGLLEKVRTMIKVENEKLQLQHAAVRASSGRPCPHCYGRISSSSLECDGCGYNVS